MTRPIASTLTAAVLCFVLIGCTAGQLTTEQARQVREGMSQREVVEQFGKPIDINTTRTRGTVRDQFVYQGPGGQYDRVYIYFQDYVVTSVQY